MSAPKPPLALIAEDEFLIALDIQAILQGIGLRTTQPVARGVDAVRLALAEKPDLLVMDIRLLDRMDGIEAAAAIVERHPVPVIFLTAYSDPETRGRAARVPRSTLLTKPAVPAILRNAIAAALGRGPADS